MIPSSPQLLILFIEKRRKKGAEKKSKKEKKKKQNLKDWSMRFIPTWESNLYYIKSKLAITE